MLVNGSNANKNSMVCMDVVIQMAISVLHGSIDMKAATVKCSGLGSALMVPIIEETYNNAQMSRLGH